MSRKKVALVLCMLLAGCFFNRKALSTPCENKNLQKTVLNVANGQPVRKQHLEKEEDSYLEGYIQALVNSHYYEFNILVYIENGDVYLYNLPKNDLIKNSILRFVKDLPEIRSVTEVFKFPKERLKTLKNREIRPQIKGIWFPQTTVLFPPMIANPRATLYSANYRSGDRGVYADSCHAVNHQKMGKTSTIVSLGDSFPIYRWCNVLKWKGDLQIEIQGGIWSMFRMGVRRPRGEFAQMVNTDFLLGVPLSYAVNKWAFRLRIYHISGHLGDEFMQDHREHERLNPSMEAVDFFTAYQVSKNLRVYFGPGWVFHSDKSYPIKPFYLEYGGELRFLGRKSYYHKLYGTFFIATYIRNWQAVHWRFDVSSIFGYEWSKLQGVGRKMRIFINYRNGYSEGQFFTDCTSCTGLGFSWGF